MITLGIESTAHTFGISLLKCSGTGKNYKFLCNIKDTYTTESGGIIPTAAANHHEKIADELLQKALNQANIKLQDINLISYSQAPGLAPCLHVGKNFSERLSKKLNIPFVGVNHCVAHLEIGKLVTKAKNPVLLYVSGANTQVIAYEAGKYRVFGETLDMGTGNFIDTFAREIGLGFPGGPKIAELAYKGKNYIELPYTVKGMDIALSGILTNLRQKIARADAFDINKIINKKDFDDDKKQDGDLVNNKDLLEKKIPAHSCSQIDNKLLKKKIQDDNGNGEDLKLTDKENLVNVNEPVNYTVEDLCYSMQETVFAMLVETAERALAHTGKKELLLGGGVACNKRLQEMCKIMCGERTFSSSTDSSQSRTKERGAKFFVPENNLLVDNGAMIAFLGEIMFKSGIKNKADEVDIKPRERTDQVNVCWCS